MAAITKRLRYEVLRRDGHACYYCGAKPPEVKLEVDAVVPEALGGSHKDPANLVTACKDCNGGKSASAPDAPLVAAVADDAAKWADAVAAAAQAAEADVTRREQAYAAFDERWGDWTWGADKAPVPRPDNWRKSVDAFLNAGLPIEVLLWCIDRAMDGKPRPHSKFRYMCGIAWRRIAEIQEQAKQATAGPATPDGDEPTPEMVAGRADLARELLSDLDLGEINRLRAEAREDRGAETKQTECIEAIHIAWQERRIGYRWLAFSVYDLLRELPDDVGKLAMRQARAELYDEHGPEFSREDFADRAVGVAVREYEDRANEAYLSAMDIDERAEWEMFADAVFSTGHLSGHCALLYPAACARSVKEEGARYNGMCDAGGRRIPVCSGKAVSYVRFAELECCQDSDETHREHKFCDDHLQLALAGGLKRGDVDLSVTSQVPLSDADKETVPF